MLEFLLALLTTATVGALLIPLLRTKVQIERPARRRAGDLSRPAGRAGARARRRHHRPRGEAAAARTEIERRILAAADSAKTAAPAASPVLHKFLPPALALALPLLALGLYLQVGRPGLPAAPFVARPAAPAAGEPLDLPRLVAAARSARPSNPTIPTRSRRWARP